MKKFTETGGRRYTCQQPATKSARGPDDKLQVNPWSTRRFFPPPVKVGFPLFVRAKRCPGQVVTVHWGARGAVGF